MFTKNLSVTLILLTASPAFADEAKKPDVAETVTLTKQELGELVQAEVTAAIGRERSAAVYAKVNAAFAPKGKP